MKLKPIKENIKAIEGRNIFLRVDFNVPLKGKKILDETKIIAVLPTIRFLLRYKCKIILATHLGEPNGKKNAELSVKPVFRRLGALLGASRVKFAGEIVGKKVDDAFKKIKGGEILMLENLRFDKGEEKNDKKFAKALAKNCEVYVNEAFSVCHRNHASVAVIRKYLPSFAGLLLMDEITNLDKAKNPVKPLVLVMGGAKIHTKINLIKNLEKHAGHILIGGALANNFFKALGLSVGKSLIDKESVLLAKKLLRNKKIMLPYDVIVANKKNITVRLADQVQKDDIIYDIGPRTINLYSCIIGDAKTIIWNGPLGAFENPHFRHGTVALGQIIAARSRGRAFGVVGGGETLEALKLTKMEHYVDWISTGGGAMLAYLGGEKMPGLE